MSEQSSADRDHDAYTRAKVRHCPTGEHPPYSVAASACPACVEAARRAQHMREVSVMGADEREQKRGRAGGRAGGLASARARLLSVPLVSASERRRRAALRFRLTAERADLRDKLAAIEAKLAEMGVEP